MNNPNDQKEVYLTYFIVVLASLSLAVSAYLVDIGVKSTFDIINNLFFSSVLVLFAILFIELLNKHKAVSRIACGVFISSGLYLIWNQ